MPTPGGGGIYFLLTGSRAGRGEGYDFCRFSSRISLIAFRLRRGNLCKFALFLENIICTLFSGVVGCVPLCASCP